jgi:PAS domain S-box-containing protein
MDIEDSRSTDELLEEISQLRDRLDEAEETLRAIRHGEVDAIVVSGPGGDQVFSLTGAEHVYRVVVETMHEAALTVDLDGTILFCNQRFCDLMKTPMQEIIGRELAAFAAEPQKAPLNELLADARKAPVYRRLPLRAADGTTVPLQFAASPLQAEAGPGLCLVVADLTELEASANSIKVLHQHEQALQAQQAELLRRREELERHVEELRASNAELQYFNRVMIDRELRMVELKKEVDALRAQLGQPPRYTVESEQK